jgi:small subunit ribosomal protein S17
MSDETNPTATDDTQASVTDVNASETTATETKVTEPKVVVTKVTEAKTSETDETRSNPRKVREGIVVSDKMDSTLVVAVNERVSHARYGKTVQRTKKLYVHDEKNEAKLGDRVRVQETRPLSKLKRWRLTEVVERAR